jgi:peptidoglycan-associated lipoprotein
MRRAQAVRDFLIKNGISSDRFTIVSYGEERPFGTCRNESCWQQNRRVHFVQQ